MKKNIHPKVYPVVFVDTSSGVEFITTSTLKSESKKTIDGVEYFVVPMEISSASHPFYTGKQSLVDTARRVERFQKTMEKVKAMSGTRKGKKVKTAERKAKKVSKEDK